MKKNIREFIIYGKTHFGLNEADALFFENMLLGRYGEDAPYEGEVDEEAIRLLTVPDSLVASFIQEAEQEGMDSVKAELEAVFCLGLLSPTPSALERRFHELYEQSPDQAMEYLYEVSVANFYVREEALKKNVHFDASFEDGSPLEITINLSKPEKKNSDIAKLVNLPKTGYPACLLCKENLGFYGNARHPARSNLRFVELPLDGEKWYLQFSPYGYFHRHCILFSEEHIPMLMDKSALTKLLAFLDLFPEYFVGCNSDLPIVGGSILNHLHFQGGKHLLPLMKAPMKSEREIEEGVYAGIVDFYANTIRFRGKNAAKIVECAENLRKKWTDFDCPECEILSHTGGVRHNAITTLSRKEGDDYLLYVILRNNRTNEEYPDGIFHAHPDKFHIKSEGIGLIEAGGLFILPGRLLKECAKVEQVVQGGMTPELEGDPVIEKMAPMIEEMKRTGKSVRAYLAGVCQNILRDIAVFKDDETGRKGLKKFLEVLGYGLD